VGLDGKKFTMYKFRSMKVGAEEETGPVWTRKDDPRRTRLGVLLRKLSLDEVPQLYNVLKGEMSLVGPRPERPFFVDQFRKLVPKYLDRHRVKTGMTGWAQVNGFRGETSLEERIRFDLYYIENWSLTFDFKILLRTLHAALSAKGVE
jgi:lipopolysaccharide/colanic/teichoic acid biosynthesis glycosyltransferase